MLSFLFQKGKCRYCHKKISRLYPILEIGSALIFGSVWRFLGDQGLGVTLFWTVTGRMLWLMIVYDVLRYEVHIPLLIAVNVAVIFAIGTGLF